jgi:hypothetical protein
MRRNMARAYDCLQTEHARIREEFIKILAQNNRAVERHLLQADLDNPRHHDDMLLYEARLSRPPAGARSQSQSLWQEDRAHHGGPTTLVARAASS